MQDICTDTCTTIGKVKDEFGSHTVSYAAHDLILHLVSGTAIILGSAYVMQYQTSYYKDHDCIRQCILLFCIKQCVLLHY